MSLVSAMAKCNAPRNAWSKERGPSGIPCAVSYRPVSRHFAEVLVKLETCAALQQSIAKISKHDHVGSTATMVALDNSSIWSVNVGDSRSVLCRSGKAIDLSIDHKPNMPSELERITTLGGRVKWYGWEDEDGEPVASMGAWRINGNLSC